MKMSEANKQAESGSGSSRCYRAVERAKDIVRTNEWEGDMRVNMTTIIGAGRVLAKRVEELEAIICGGICNFNQPCGECERCAAVRESIESR